VRVCETRLPPGPGVRTQTTTTFLPMSRPATRSTSTSTLITSQIDTRVSPGGAHVIGDRPACSTATMRHTPSPRVELFCGLNRTRVARRHRTAPPFSSHRPNGEARAHHSSCISDAEAAASRRCAAPQRLARQISSVAKPLGGTRGRGATPMRETQPPRRCASTVRLLPVVAADMTQCSKLPARRPMTARVV